MVRAQLKDCVGRYHVFCHRGLYDARGIFVAYVCDKCEKRVKAKYRPEIFTNANYYADEAIDEG